MRAHKHTHTRRTTVVTVNLDHHNHVQVAETEAKSMAGLAPLRPAGNTTTNNNKNSVTASQPAVENKLVAPSDDAAPSKVT